MSTEDLGDIEGPHQSDASSNAEKDQDAHGSPPDAYLEQLYRSRLKLLTRIGAFATAGYATVSLVQFHIGRVTTDILALSLYLTSEWYRRKPEQFQRARVFFLLALAVSFFGTPVFAGNFDSEIPWLYGLVPLATAHVCGPKSVLPSFILTVAGLFFVLELSPLLPVKQEFLIDEKYHLSLVALTVGVFGGISVSLSASSEKLIRELKASSVKLIQRRAQIDSATQSKSVFLANMSHEIRTPMTGILGMLSELEEQPNTDEEREMLDVAATSGLQLLDSLNKVLDFSKMEAGKLALAKTPFAPNRVFERVRDHYASFAAQKGLALEFDMPAEELRVMGDSGRLHQMLAILVDNALRYSDAGTVLVSIAVTPPTKAGRCRYEISVSDTGPGISKKAQAQLFSEFQSLDEEQEHRSGIGLGLVLAKNLAGLMDGDLEVRSTLGEGTTFHGSITLPLYDGEISAPECEPFSESPERLRVLVVDDNPINRRVVRAQLAKLGYEVQEAPDGEQALELANENPFDAILMDLELPGLNGFDCARQIRQSSGQSTNARIIAFSADFGPHAQESITLAGMNGSLLKPARPAALLHAIQPERQVSGGVHDTGRRIAGAV